jgi:hypothetical protein
MVRELNRRNRTQIVIEDPRVRRLRVFNFGFDPSRPEDLVERANRLSRDAPGQDGRGASPTPDVNPGVNPAVNPGALRLERP